jgi:hypothetical protein
MNKFALAAVATAALGAAATSPANARITANGPQLTGIALQSVEINHPVVTAVTLPSGETVDLRQVEGASSRRWAMFGRRVVPLARGIGLATALAISTPIAVPAQTALTAAGTEFVLTTPGGRTLHSADLVGATLNIAAAGRRVEVTIRSVEEDRHAVRGLPPPPPTIKFASLSKRAVALGVYPLQRSPCFAIVRFALVQSQ